MRGGLAVVLGWTLLSGAAVARAESQDLGERELRYEMSINAELRRYIRRNGFPDVAETRFLADAPPWDDHEVAVYYLGPHKELSFARAWILGEPSIAKIRIERMLTDEEVSDLTPRVRQYGSGSCTHRGCPMTGSGVQAQGGSTPNGPAERAEAAAERAELAAARVDKAARVAERAAERSEAVVTKMEERQVRRARPKAPELPSVAP